MWLPECVVCGKDSIENTKPLCRKTHREGRETDIIFSLYTKVN